MTQDQPAPAAEPVHPFVHDPAPPTPRQLVPDRAGFLRGLALAAFAGVALLGAAETVQRLGWLASPLAALLGGTGVLSAWAAVIHLTGGEKFDDHPWV